MNLYAYVYNDPINVTDPSGECGGGWCVAAVAATVHCLKSSACRGQVYKGVKKVAAVVTAAVATKELSDLASYSQRGIEAQQKRADALSSYAKGEGSFEEVVTTQSESVDAFHNTIGAAGDFGKSTVDKGKSVVADVHTLSTASESFTTESKISTTDKKTMTCIGSRIKKTSC